jgi:hypothetical protein
MASQPWDQERTRQVLFSPRSGRHQERYLRNQEEPWSGSAEVRVVCVPPRFFAHMFTTRTRDEKPHRNAKRAYLCATRTRREKFLRVANTDFAALRNDPEVWKQELRERDLWENTVADGLAKESIRR